MSTASFPALPGLGYSTHKRPTFSTKIAEHISGREVRAARWAYPLWEFELTFNFLRGAAAFAEMQTLAGFFLERQGQFDTFLFADPNDYTVTGQLLGVGDGVTTTFTCVRSFGGWIEPVGRIGAISAIYLNGVAQPSGWSTAAPNTLTFASAPSIGEQITADFSFWFVCRFTEDVHDYEEFMMNLWRLQSCKFRSVKP